MLKKLAKQVLSRTPLRGAVFPRYDYLFTPPQLMLLCELLGRSSETEGAIAEIGCAAGATTIFLNRYMDASGIDKPYFALDTFSGFVGEDIAAEVDRGKSAARYTGFRANKRQWFEETLRENGVARVRAVEADVNRFDLKSFGALSFVLLDVDLYRPIKHALPILWEQLCVGGFIVVDDCTPQGGIFDGAGHAYDEFMRTIGKPTDVRLGKLGVLSKHY